MSLDYTLNVATHLTPLSFATLMASESPMTQENVDLWGRAINARVLGSDELSRQIIEEGFGFTPTIAIVFHVVPSQGYEEGVSIMVSAVAAVLRHVPGDAVLLKSSELMMLQRRGKRVSVDEDWARWFVPALENAGIAVERRGKVELRE